MLKAFRQLTLVLVLITGTIWLVGCGREIEINDPGGEFSYNHFSVIMGRNASRRVGDFIKNDFPELTLSHVSDTGNLDCGRRYLILILYGPGRINVLTAVSTLNQRRDVYLAEISRMYPPDVEDLKGVIYV